MMRGSPSISRKPRLTSRRSRQLLPLLGLIKERTTVAGAEVRDLETAPSSRCRARTVINATGVLRRRRAPPRRTAREFARRRQPGHAPRAAAEFLPGDVAFDDSKNFRWSRVVRDSVARSRGGGHDRYTGDGKIARAAFRSMPNANSSSRMRAAISHGIRPDATC